MDGIEGGLHRRKALQTGLAALALALTGRPRSAHATPELGDLPPDELFRRLQTELAPSGSMRAWLEGDRTQKEIIHFFQTLMPVVEELEKVHHEGSKYREFQKFALDVSSIQHQYHVTLRLKGGKGFMRGHCSLVLHKGRLYLVTAKHVVKDTEAEHAFGVEGAEYRGDIAAVPIDFARSKEFLEALRPNIDGKTPVNRVAPVNSEQSQSIDRAGRVFLFKSTMHDDFDFALRLSIPLTPAVAFLMLYPAKGTAATEQKLSQMPQDVQDTCREFARNNDIFFITPSSFIEKVQSGALHAQGRSGGSVFSADQLLYEGVSEALVTNPLPNGRTLFLITQKGALPDLLDSLSAAPAIPIQDIPGMDIKPIPRWSTTLTKET